MKKDKKMDKNEKDEQMDKSEKRMKRWIKMKKG